MQHFDGEIEKMIRAEVITRTTGMLYATNAGNLAIRIADVPSDDKPLGLGTR
jgi:twitching motility protein PilT